MPLATICLTGTASRARACAWVNRAACGVTMDLREPKRTTAQNDLMWAMLTDIARQHKHHGMKLRAEDWKLLFMDALGQELRAVPNLEGSGFVNLGRSSSRLGVKEMSDLITLMEAFAAQHGIELKE